MTDSGLGGLNICAGLEARLRRAAVPGNPAFRLTYVNAWPFEQHGYNAMPDPSARAAMFDGALSAIAALKPDLIIIACNTLSVLYPLTAFSRKPSAPVAGIIEEGAAFFHEALTNDPDGVLLIFGTRTTVLSGEHARLLTALGTDPERIRGTACHGLAGVVDKDPGSPAASAMVARCVTKAVAGLPPEGTVYAGLCCTHYSYITDAFRAALETQTGRKVVVLDPGEHFIDRLMAGLAERPSTGGPGIDADTVSAAPSAIPAIPAIPATPSIPDILDSPDITVEVISKVELAADQRKAVARKLVKKSPRTARALLEYTRTPELF